MTERETPWSIEYGDGAANEYRFSQASPGAEVRFRYDPVTPAMSSSGEYSGGDPVEASLPAGDARLADLWREVDRLAADRSLHAPSRMMGTGVLTITVGETTREVIIQSGADLDAFDALVSGFRR